MAIETMEIAPDIIAAGLAEYLLTKYQLKHGSYGSALPPYELREQLRKDIRQYLRSENLPGTVVPIG